MHPKEGFAHPESHTQSAALQPRLLLSTARTALLDAEAETETIKDAIDKKPDIRACKNGGYAGTFTDSNLRTHHIPIANSYFHMGMLS